MQQFFADMLNRIEDLHRYYAQYLDGLTTEQLDWKPGDDMNSLGILAVHVTQSERYWIGVALDDVIQRDRPAEFEAHGYTVDALLQRFDNNRAYYATAFASADTNTFDEVVQSPLFPDRPFTCTRGWALLHALDHTAEHLGHVGITRQLLDAQA